MKKSSEKVWQFEIFLYLCIQKDEANIGGILSVLYFLFNLNNYLHLC